MKRNIIFYYRRIDKRNNFNTGWVEVGYKDYLFLMADNLTNNSEYKRWSEVKQCMIHYLTIYEE